MYLIFSAGQGSLAATKANLTWTSLSKGESFDPYNATEEGKKQSFLTHQEREFFQSSYAFYTPTNKAWNFRLLHILADKRSVFFFFPCHHMVLSCSF